MGARRLSFIKSLMLLPLGFRFQEIWGLEGLIGRPQVKSLNQHNRVWMHSIVIQEVQRHFIRFLPSSLLSVP